MIGTPPGGGRRRSTSTGLCETPPSPNCWSVSPIAVHKQYANNTSRRSYSPPIIFNSHQYPNNSPILRSHSPTFPVHSSMRRPQSPPMFTDTPMRGIQTPPMLSGPLSRVPILSSPNLSDNNNLRHSPIIPFGTRAMTLPEISEMGNFQTFFNETSNNAIEQHPITFMPPELTEETLLEVGAEETMKCVN